MYGLQGHDQYEIDRPFEGFLRRLFDFEEFGQPWFRARFELDQQVGIATERVEIPIARGRSKDVQPSDVKTPAKIGQRLALAAGGRVHGWGRFP